MAQGECRRDQGRPPRMVVVHDARVDDPQRTPVAPRIPAQIAREQWIAALGAEVVDDLDARAARLERVSQALDMSRDAAVRRWVRTDKKNVKVTHVCG